MIKVRFLTDYRGVLTREVFYTAGEVVEFDDVMAEDLLVAGRVERVVTEPTPEPEVVEPKSKPKRKPKKKPKKKVKK